MSTIHSLQEYSKLSAETDQLVDKRDSVSLLAAGLFGEIGSILTEVKKVGREGDAYPAYRQRLHEEFGDALWYLTRLYSILAPLELERLSFPGEGNVGSTGDSLSRALALGETISVLLGALESKNPATTWQQLRIVWEALGEASSAAGISLRHAAEGNLAKIASRWPKTKQYMEFFDVNCPEEEQIPRLLNIEFRQRVIGMRRVVVIRCNGLNVGNRLTDNIERPDAYRFHDVFHFAYAVYLGWSPVVRALLNCKRKSTPEVDENQDGARARVIEEGVSATVFARSKRMALYQGVGQVDYDLLKTIHGFVSGFEVERVPLWQWEKAILTGHSVFRKLKADSGGHVKVDLQRRELTYLGPPGGSSGNDN